MEVEADALTHAEQELTDCLEHHANQMSARLIARRVVIAYLQNTKPDTGKETK